MMALSSSSHRKGALDRFPQDPHQFFLLFLQRTAETGRVDKKEIVADRIAVKKDFLVAQGAFGTVGELQCRRSLHSTLRTW